MRTHRKPREKRAMRPIFCFLFILSVARTGIGKRKIAKSVTTFKIELSIDTHRPRHFPGTCGSQLAWIGTQFMNMEMKTQELQAMSTPITTQAAICGAPRSKKRM